MALSRNYKRASDAWKKASQRWQDIERSYFQERTINISTYDLERVRYNSAKERYDKAFTQEHERVVPPEQRKKTKHQVLSDIIEALNSCFQSLERRRIQAGLELEVEQKDGPQLAKVRAALAAARQLRSEEAA